ncbi:MAG TPA: glycogen-binding domain-containing protein, partial [Puia sp.]
MEIGAPRQLNRIRPAFRRLGILMSTTLIILLLCVTDLQAQKAHQSYTIRDGRMYISLSRDIGLSALDSFMSRYNLNAIGLYQFIRTRTMDSLKKLGWKVEMDQPKKFVISKPLFSSGNFGNPAGEILLTEKHPNLTEMFPSVNNGTRCGYNSFRRKHPFAQTGDGTVTIFLRGNIQAGRVMLAGSFNNWVPNALAMTRTDSGWISILHLSPGKYWYKFIIDGRWRTDEDNLLSQNDGEGNTNSVFYVTNFDFVLQGFTNARKVFVAGSFND